MIGPLRTVLGSEGLHDIDKGAKQAIAACPIVCRGQKKEGCRGIMNSDTRCGHLNV